jgi:hypothetical protein
MGMWWEWGQITSLDVILLSILSPLIFALIGCGFLKLFSVFCKNKASGISSNFDYLQKLNFYMVLGFGFLFLVVLIFSLVNLPFLLCILIVILVAALGFVLRPYKLKIRLMGKMEFVKKYSFTLVVLVFLLFLVALSSSLIIGLYGTSNCDGADHTFFTRLILDNPNVLWTHSAKPYADTLIQYPLSAHVLSAFLVTLINIPIQKVIIIMTVILPALIALSFYSTIKCLFNNRLTSIIGLSISGCFSISFIFGPIWWSGLSLLLSLYLSISGIGLIYILMSKKEMTWFSAFLIGLLVLLASQTYPVSFLLLSFWFLMLLGFKLLLQFRHKIPLASIFSMQQVSILLAFLIPILLIIPYLYFAFSLKIPTGQYLELELGSSWSVETIRDHLFFNWLNIPEQTLFFQSFANLLMLAPFSLFIIFVLVVPKVYKRLPKGFGIDNFYPSLVLVYLSMLLVVGYLALTLLPIESLLVFMDPERIWQHIYIFAVILTSVVVFSGIYFSYLGLRHIFESIKGNILRLNRSRIIGCVLLIVLIFNVAAVSIPLFTEQQDGYNTVKSSFNRDTLKQTDLSLMKWIIDNTPLDCRILISQTDSGQFVSAVTQRFTIAMENYTIDYSNLMQILTVNASDPQAIPLLVGLNVTHVYIGSTAITYDIPKYYYRQFNATQMLNTPYFTLVIQFGDVSLFSFNSTIASNIYSEFEKKT